ncbi:5906_t:CDS:10 [Ambispora gerdemannii]|uniref:Regulator of telomere elongation helicase 1 homolog n=1 Tax=Ambispora gerdemannii TaxID=144530 RepID=A0A9N8WJF0_9GLOM|nr:5906_t:CDS:10 [Ambispora gerdemannii]
MPEYNIKGLKVLFPYDAYSCQRTLMEKLITSLQSNTNALLESPTGTGKTLCLLCATLAWREAYMARRQFEYHARENKESDKFNKELLSNLNAAVSTLPNSENYSRPPPIIYYASRTHSQLSQAINDPRICVLGSREQLCIHPTVNKIKSNAARTAVCRDKIKKKRCQYIQGVDTAKILPDFDGEVLDIEDLIKFGKKNVACPYFLSRENQNNADIIFLPYNYLIDASSRKAQNLNLDNAILIFDEAHNLESSCSEATSFEITSDDLQACISEARYCAEKARSPLHTSDITEEDYILLRGIYLVWYLEFFLKFLTEINNVVFPYSSIEINKPGEWIYELFGKANLDSGTFDHVRNIMEAANEILMTDDFDKKRNSRDATHHLLFSLKIMFGDTLGNDKTERTNNAKYYRTFIVNLERTLSFWCFSPGLAMRDLTGGNCRSIILTSGTLAPLPSFATELQVDFKVQFEGPHVISSDQALVGVIKKGPTGIALNSSYNSRNNANYQQELGRTIVNFSRFIPDGLIVFFPSYGVMNDCIKNWQRPTPGNNPRLWDILTQNKEPVIESKNKQEFIDTMARFDKKILERGRGSIFFAVCRGKVSEGIDFTDAKGRAVIITGIPYPPFRDPKVTLKREYLDGARKQSLNKSMCISGDDWYKQQATRAVNQALGRVIRHHKDFGAILLCDERFAAPPTIAQLPVWIRPLVKVYDNFGQIHGQIHNFFQEMNLKMNEVDVKKTAERNSSSTTSIYLDRLSVHTSKNSINEQQPLAHKKLKHQRIEYESEITTTSTSSLKSSSQTNSRKKSKLDENESWTTTTVKSEKSSADTISSTTASLRTAKITSKKVVKRNALGMLIEKK